MKYELILANGETLGLTIKQYEEIVEQIINKKVSFCRIRRKDEELLWNVNDIKFIRKGGMNNGN